MYNNDYKVVAEVLNEARLTRAIPASAVLQIALLFDQKYKQDSNYKSDQFLEMALRGSVVADV